MMNSVVRRIFVEKKSGYDVEAHSFYQDLQENLGVKGLEKVRIINRYDVSGISDQEYAAARWTIFAEPPVDLVYDEQLPVEPEARIFAMEYLPGQYDQRADSAGQCIQILTQKDRPAIASAKVVVLYGQISDAEFAKIKAYYINPVESREAGLGKPESLEMLTEQPPDVAEITGFTLLDEKGLLELHQSFGLAMSVADLVFCQEYFRDTERRDPTITEIRVIDTYWSDHCRHTTFLTKITEVEIAESPLTAPLSEAYRLYLADREAVYGRQEKDVCLMDIAVMAMKKLRQEGRLSDLDQSEEVNACSIIVNADVDGKVEEWLVMFKNETHNHPTEIEPFGGAATCLGGAIRDPLSGRSYVYQAMRVTGSADPRTPLEDTLPGKLPQRKITTGAASGYSSYGNQIGLATGQVAEVYDENFVAKRMEIGAVIAAAPKKNVVRAVPEPGDAVILLGGRTGRDGCGGATGSSKEHTEESLASCGAEVQKGNPPEERKIQRLFRNPAVSTLIKRCNDFGAGGVSVAVGELADGLEVNLDIIPKKYDGLDGTELAISESQERMAVVVEAKNTEEFIAAARRENLEAVAVARVTAARRLKMTWRGQQIVDLSRDFLDTNGVKQTTKVRVAAPEQAGAYFDSVPDGVAAVLDSARGNGPGEACRLAAGRCGTAAGASTVSGAASGTLRAAWLANLRDLNVCSQKGLVERFDSTIGAGTVQMPFGGKYQATPAEGMAAKLPLLNGDTTTGTLMTYGYSPRLALWSPFHGALTAVVEAAAKIVAMGGSFRQIRLTLQEYFEKLGTDPLKWGKPFSALLGAYLAQRELGIPAIGGKDSMSGTFKDLNVPPTLVAFAVEATDVRQLVSAEFKQVGRPVFLVTVQRKANGIPDFASLTANFDLVAALAKEGKILSASTVRYGGIAAALSKMCFGNRIGFAFDSNSQADQARIRRLFTPEHGSLVLEAAEDFDSAELAARGGHAWLKLGHTQLRPLISLPEGTVIELKDALDAWTEPLEKIFPSQAEAETGEPVNVHDSRRNTHRPQVKIARPRVLIPVFPGTNCEYDTARVFEQAGAVAETFVIRNLSSAEIEDSIDALAKAIKSSQIVMLPGGFSGGDEPDGSGKFIATAFRNPRVKEAVLELLKRRDGLMLGICNGFQALIKLGLVPYGEILDITDECPTLTYNTIGRHVSCLVQTKIASTLSPWLQNVRTGDLHTIAVSHGEGRFAAPGSVIETLYQNGQIATQYVNPEGIPTYDPEFNPNGSCWAIEGITSPDGRVLGKMGHSERIGPNLYRNVPGEKDQKLFQAGVQYFRD